MKNRKFITILLSLLLLALVLPQTLSQTNTKTYRVKSGDKLALIARQFDLSVDEIVALNNIDNVNSIRIGQVLRVSLDNLVIIEDAVINPLPSNKDPISSQHTKILNEIKIMLETEYLADTTVNNQASTFTGVLWPTAYPQPIKNIIFTPNTIVQGESFNMTIELESFVPLHAHFVGQRFPFFVDSETSQHAVLAVPVVQKAGIYPLDLEYQNLDGTIQNLTLPIPIMASNLESENITSLPITTSRLGQETNHLEEERIAKQCANYTAERHWDSAFRYPVDTVNISSNFGNQRVYKGSPASSVHQGLDFKTQRNAPVYASATGIVRLANDLSIRGSTVIIDHGMGLCTIYSHLSGIKINEGDMVSKDDVIGTVGASGLVNHDNLHWELQIMGIAVNPEPWIEE